MDAKDLESLFKEKLAASHVEVVDQSAGHAGHLGAQMGGGHFQAIIVSPQFENLSVLDRHRLVYQLVGMPNIPAIHALSMKTLTPSEWKKSSL